VADVTDFPFAGGVDLGLYGLSQAIERFLPATNAMLNGEGAKAVAIVVGEALWWVASIDDFFRTKLGDQRWWSLRAADQDGQCVAGLIYARNLHSHELTPLGCLAEEKPGPSPETPPPAPPSDLGPNDQFVIVGSVASLRLAWRKLENLPAPAEPERHGRDRLYKLRVADRRLAEPFRDALAFFTASRPLLP
jgi:hypothetical protein